MCEMGEVTLMERKPAMQMRKPNTPCSHGLGQLSSSANKRNTTHSDASADEESAKLPLLSLARDHLENGKDLSTNEYEGEDHERREQVGVVSEVEGTTDDGEGALDDNGVHGGRDGGSDSKGYADEGGRHVLG